MLSTIRVLNAECSLELDQAKWSGINSVKAQLVLFTKGIQFQRSRRSLVGSVLDY